LVVRKTQPGFAGPESVGTLLVAEAGRLAVEAKQRSPFLGIPGDFQWGYPKLTGWFIEWKSLLKWMMI
jgi:hypothetical protein